ncbi:MAG: recombinase family protein [Defluviitaleaceae bacterium]|nr:recombinase family protein [Defluviitaleaceae bacterium]
MINTGIYVRVSTEEQVREGYSIRAQEEKLQNYAKLKEWNILGIYADEGISAKDIEGRPEVKRLIADVVSGKINNVLVYKIDRLTRSTKNLIELIDLFNENQCAFNSLCESIDTSSATGRMFLKIVGIFAEFERENLAERVKLGFERKAKEGYSVCTITPSYGYSRSKGTKIQKEEPIEAGIVRRIFNMYLHDDYSMHKIVQILNAEKIPTKKGKLWNAKTVKLVLQNPNYIGKVRYACNDAKNYFEAKGQHEAILDEGIFYQVQEKISKIKKITRTKRPRSGVYFCGVLRCPLCESKLSTKWNYNKSKVGYPSYRCINALKGVCNAKTMSHAKTTTAFEEYISRIEDFSETAELPDNTPTYDNAEITAITAELEKTEKKTAEIMNLFVSDAIDFSTYQGMVKASNERRNILQTRLGLLTNESEDGEAHYTTPEIIANFRDNWNSLDNEKRLQFVQKFIKKIIIHSESQGKNAIHGNVIIREVVFNEF